MNDVLGLLLFVGFGVWWLLFPKSVIKFYGWFHRSKVKLPTAAIIRILGIIWIVLVITIWQLSISRQP